MLKGKNILLRNLKKSDIDFLMSIENNISLWEHGSERKIYTKQELVSYIKNSHIPFFEARQYRFVIDYKNFPIGFIDLFDYFENQASVGIIIHKNYQNKGFGKEALILLSNYSLNVLKLKKLQCCIQKNNYKSNRLFLSASYKLVKEEKNMNFYTFV